MSVAMALSDLERRDVDLDGQVNQWTNGLIGGAAGAVEPCHVGPT